MKVVFRTALALAGLIGLAGAASLWLPASYFAEHSVLVNTKPYHIFPFVNNLESWQQWTPWDQETDPSVVYLYSGPVAGVGSQQSWKGRNTPHRQMVVIESLTNEQFCYDLQIENGRYRGSGTIYFTPTKEGTLVTWRTDALLPEGPVEKYKALFARSMLQKDLEKGLIKLKSLAEQRAATADAAIK